MAIVQKFQVKTRFCSEQWSTFSMWTERGSSRVEDI